MLNITLIEPELHTQLAKVFLLYLVSVMTRSTGKMEDNRMHIERQLDPGYKPTKGLLSFGAVL